MDGISLAEAKEMVGKGWSKLLDDIYEKLYELDYDDWAISDVKEKYGTLRVYAYNLTGDVDDFIWEKEKESSKVCEYCGKPGEMRNLSWIKTLCEDCLKKKLDNTLDL